jgi:hypothetical protein
MAGFFIYPIDKFLQGICIFVIYKKNYEKTIRNCFSISRLLFKITKYL